MFLLCSAPLTASAAVLHVPDDYLSIQEAINNAVSGDTVQVAPGVYNGSITMQRGVDVIGAGADHSTINGSGIAVVWGAHNSTLAGFTLTGGGFAGVWLQRASTTVRDNVIYGMRTGVYVYQVSNPTIINNEIRDIRERAITVWWYSSAIIEGNHISNARDGVAVLSRAGARVVGNRFEHVGTSMGHQSGARSSLFANNTVLGGGTGVLIRAGRIDVLNNSFADGQRAVLYNGGGGVTINNIMVGSLFEPATCGGAFLNNILFDNSRAVYWNCRPVDPSNIYADPLFVDRANGDFQVLRGSPAVDAGWNDAPGLPSLDLLGNTRINDDDGNGFAQVDIGAYEGPSGCFDADSDSVCDEDDNCPLIPNADQLDSDSDGAGDLCDICRFDPLDDQDGDGLCAEVDNCPAEFNPQQDDFDGDLLGDACDPDIDNDGVINANDACPYEDATGQDANTDGCIDSINDMGDLLNDPGIDQSIQGSLGAKVNAAAASINRGNHRSVCGQLQAFINQVEAQSGHAIDTATATMLVAYATNVMANNGCL